MASAKRTHRILLVNGYSTLQHLRALMLRMKGYNVDTAADLKSAHNVIAADDTYDLMIVDVGHFADEGLAFCDEIKKAHPTIKVLMQVDGSLYIDRNSCPDKVMNKQESPQQFVHEVEQMLLAS
jgi:DNA-binding response OmpR family regulator